MLQTFIKVANYQHVMPTRYTLEVDLKGVVSSDVVSNSSKKTEANKEAKKLLEEKFKSGKNRCDATAGGAGRLCACARALWRQGRAR